MKMAKRSFEELEVSEVSCESPNAKIHAVVVFYFTRSIAFLVGLGLLLLHFTRFIASLVGLGLLLLHFTRSIAFSDCFHTWLWGRDHFDRLLGRTRTAFTRG